MDKIAEELKIYREVGAMTASSVFKYEAKSDTFEIFGGVGMSYGSVMNNFTQMLSMQKMGRPDIVVDDFIRCLKATDNDYFECEAAFGDAHSSVKKYHVVGRFIYQSSDSTIVIGKMTEHVGDFVKSDANSYGEERDLLTGLFNKSAIKKKLAEKCAELDGRDGAFLNLRIKGPEDDNFVINVAQCLKRAFPYNAYIGCRNRHEFCIVYYGDDVYHGFKSKVDELKGTIEAICGADKIKYIIGGIYAGSFDAGEEYEINEKARLAMLTSKFRGENTITEYTGDLEAINDSSFDDREVKSLTSDNFSEKLFNDIYDSVAMTGDFVGAINRLLENVGTRFGIDRIMIQELDTESSSIHTTYEWTQDRYSYLTSVYNSFAEKNYIYHYDKILNNDIIVIADAKDYYKDPLYNEMATNTGLKSVVQCMFKGKLNRLGCISFEVYSSIHQWQTEELNTLKLVTKMMVTCLISKSYEEIMTVKASYATHDALTGFYKYDAFIKEAGRIISSEKNERLAIVYTGINNFLEVNARYGYEAGDVVLKECARLIENVDNFIVGCRVNADNFIALCYAFDPRGNRLSAASINTLNNRISERFDKSLTDTEITVTAGISFITDGYAIEDCVKSALEARGRAKNAGLDAILV